MALELRQQLRLSQQLIMTPQLQMAIKLLQMSHLELLDVIAEEMEQNAAIEEGDDGKDPDEEYLPEENPLAAEAPPVDPAAEAPASPEEREVTVEERVPEDMDWSNYMDEYSAPGQVAYESEERELPKYDTFIARKESITEHMLWQLMLRFSEPAQQEIGEMIVGNLNRDGYLEATVEEIATVCNKEPKMVEEVLLAMQTFDPPGICARDLSECLLIQADLLGLDDPLLLTIIKNHLNHLQNKNYKAICSATRASMETVISAVRLIMTLEPKPGRMYEDEEPHYITPDIFVYKVGDEFEIVLNDDGLPKLHVSAFYKKALADGQALSDDTKNYVQGKLRSAAWLIRSIHQRQRTIYKVMESIVKFQTDFLEKGIQYLKPMVLRDVAEDISMHESTISRVTTNKYAHTPQGIFELKYFFNSSINRVHGGAIASASVKERILQIIRSENPKKPFSDDKIAAILAKDNIKIARRTIAKYREMLGILPSSKRKVLM